MSCILVRTKHENFLVFLRRGVILLIEEEELMRWQGGKCLDLIHDLKQRGLFVESVLLHK